MWNVNEGDSVNVVEKVKFSINYVECKFNKIEERKEMQNESFLLTMWNVNLHEVRAKEESEQFSINYVECKYY